MKKAIEKLQEIWGNKWVRFSVVSLIYVLWFVVWTRNLLWLPGVAVIYVGEDLDVLLELADRILVLCGGKVSGIVPGRGAKKRDVGMMMTRLGGNAANE